MLSTQDLEMPRGVTLVGVTQYSGLTDCTAASGWVMSCCSTRNVIVAQGDRRHSLRIARARRSDVSADLVDTPKLCPSVSLRVFTVQEGEGS